MNPIKFIIPRTVGGVILVLCLSVRAVGMASAETLQSNGPEWTVEGELVLPRDFREWRFLGAPLTPNALNAGKAGFPEYHNVYIQPEALAIYQSTGRFPEGTILVKELQLTMAGQNPDGSRLEASGRGYFPGALMGIDIAVKDAARFADTRGWGFFNFGHHAPPYAKVAAIQPRESCAACHMANGTDMVFIKFYTEILNAE